MTQPFKKLIPGQRVRNYDREANERYLQQSLKNPEIKAEHRLLLKTFFLSYRTAKGKPLAINSQVSYLVCLRKFFRTCSRPVQDVTREDLDLFFNSLTQSERTIEGYRVLIRSFFQWFYLKKNSQKRAEKKRSKEHFEELFEDWPINRTVRRATPIREEDLITDEEFELMMRHAGKIRNQAIFKTLRVSSARIEEIQNTLIENLKITPQTCDISVIDSKNRRERIIPIPEARPYLLAWLKVHPAGNNPKAPLWISLRTFKKIEPICPNAIREVFRSTLKKAGISKRIHPHIFRHTRLTELSVDENMPLSLVKEISGHSNTTILEQVYVQSSQRKARETIYAQYGLHLQDEEDKKAEPQECPTCFELNKPKARFCTRCGNGMSLVAIKTNEENQKKAVAFAELFKDVPSEEIINLIKKYKES